MRKEQGTKLTTRKKTGYSENMRREVVILKNGLYIKKLPKVVKRVINSQSLD